MFKKRRPALHPDRVALIDHHRLALLRLLSGLFYMAGLGDVGVSRLTRAVRLHLLGLLRALESATRRLVYIIALETKLEPTPPKSSGANAQKKGPKSSKPSGIVGFAMFDRQWAISPPSAAGAQMQVQISDLYDWQPMAEVAPLNTSALMRRLERLQKVLGDLSSPARRMARWMKKPWPMRGRFSPLRPGRPPGLRPKGSDAADAILRECHELALLAR